MSSIFGFAWLDGRPPSREGADRMAAAGGAWKPDNVNLWHGEHAVLGRTLVARTQEDDCDRMPHVDRDRQIVLTAAGRLDNRDELCDEWNLSSSDRRAIADAALMCRAYLAWGDTAPARLRGDWAIAAWHSADRRLFLARDQTGPTSLFYWYQAPLIAFASSLDVLLALPEVARRTDEEWVARTLLVYPGPLDRTFFDGVRQLIPAHQLEATPAGLRRRRYWSAGDAPPLPATCSSDYVEGFLERYRAAVSVRLRSAGPVASTLSSGLDSGSVTALAASELRSRGQSLLALTAVPRDASSSSGAGEGPVAREVASRWDNVTHELVDAASISPISAFERTLDICSTPVHGAANLYWLLGLLGIARARGARVLLIGQAGNVTVSWNGGARRAPLFAFIKSIKAFCAAAIHPHNYAWEQWAAPNRELLRRLVRDGHLDRVNAVWRPETLHPREARERGLVYSGVASGPFYHAAGAAHRLDIRDPTTDVRLVEYCFGLPDAEHTSGGGERMVIRRAMRGWLPDSVLHSSRRARQAPDLCARLIAAGAEVTGAIDRIGASPLASAYLDVPALRRAWRIVQTGRPTGPLLAQSKLSRGLMVGLGISRLGDPQ